MANSYQEFSQPEAMLAAIRLSLKADGRLVVIEYSEDDDDGPYAGLRTMSFSQLRSKIEAAGSELNRIFDFLPMQHGLVFTKRQ